MPFSPPEGHNFKMPQRELFHLIEPQRPCSYLPDQRAALEYRGYAGLEPAELEQLLSRGWRRFGVQLFRPACRHCEQCLPIRIDVEQFQPNKTQRRIRSRNSHISVELAKPTLSSTHLELYNAWHADMESRKDWPGQTATFHSYAQSFLEGRFASAHELRYWDGDELIGVGLIDILPLSLSSIYFYHAPRWRALSPGTFSLLCEIDLARQLGRAYVYLGYWISACPSMAYKNRFHPYEILQQRPTDGELPVWRREDELQETPAEGDRSPQNPDITDPLT